MYTHNAIHFFFQRCVDLLPDFTRYEKICFSQSAFRHIILVLFHPARPRKPARNGDTHIKSRESKYCTSQGTPLEPAKIDSFRQIQNGILIQKGKT